MNSVTEMRNYICLKAKKNDSICLQHTMTELMRSFRSNVSPPSALLIKEKRLHKKGSPTVNELLNQPKHAVDSDYVYLRGKTSKLDPNGPR